MNISWFVHMIQSGLIKKIISIITMDCCNGYNHNNVPFLRTCLVDDAEDKPMSDKFNYHSVVVILFASKMKIQDNISSPVKMQNQTLSKPDITYAVSQVATFL